MRLCGFGGVRKRRGLVGDRAKILDVMGVGQVGMRRELQGEEDKWTEFLQLKAPQRIAADLGRLVDYRRHFAGAGVSTGYVNREGAGTSTEQGQQDTTG